MVNIKVKILQGLLSLLLFICFTMLVVNQPVMAADAVNQEITLDQAMSNALKNSDSLKKANKEVDRTEEIRNYQYNVMQGTSTGPAFTAEVEVPRSQLLSSDLTWRMSKKSLTAEEDKVVVDVCDKYWKILKAKKKLDADEVSLNSALKQLQVAQAGERVGLSMLPTMSPNQYVISCDSQYKGAQATLEAAKNDLNTAYIAFNQMVGFAASDRPILKDDLKYEPLKVESLDYEVARVLENHPLIWKANEAVTLQDYLKNMMFYSGSYQPYEARQIPVEQAKLDAASLKKAYEQATRSTYYAVKNLEEAYTAMQQGIKVSEENLRVKKLQFEVGMATAADVAAEEQKLAKAQSDTYEKLYQQNYYKLVFKKPWAVSGGASSSSAAAAAE